MDGPWDVILLHETHHGNEEQGLQWTIEGAGKERPWLGTSFWLAGTSASRGVAVLFKNNPDLAGVTDATPEAVRGAGRILSVDFQWMEQPFSIVHVYAPSFASERADFFGTQLLTTMPQHGGALVAGDFNCVSGDLDVTPNALGRRRKGYLGGLQLVEKTYVSRDQHPGERAITHLCASDRSGARLDRSRLSLDVLHVAQQSQIWQGLPGDHLGVTLRLQAPSDSCRGPHTPDISLAASG